MQKYNCLFEPPLVAPQIGRRSFGSHFRQSSPVKFRRAFPAASVVLCENRHHLEVRLNLLYTGRLFVLQTRMCLVTSPSFLLQLRRITMTNVLLFVFPVIYARATTLSVRNTCRSYVRRHRMPTGLQPRASPPLRARLRTRAAGWLHRHSGLLATSRPWALSSMSHRHRPTPTAHLPAEPQPFLRVTVCVQFQFMFVVMKPKVEDELFTVVPVVVNP